MNGWECQCRAKFRSAIAEAKHRHNFPALCKRRVEPKVSISFTKAELWEACNLISASFEPGQGNELASRVSDKLRKAYDKL